MADSKTILTSKYERALVFIRELEQDRDRIQKELDDYRASSKQTVKATKDLCEAILKKDNTILKPDGKSNEEKTWGEMDLKELVLKSKESFENVTKNNNALMHDMIEHNKKRTKEINVLKEQFSDMEKQKSAESEQEKKEYLEAKRNYEAAIVQVVKRGKLGRLTEKEATEILEKYSSKNVDLKTLLMQHMTFEEEKEDRLSGPISRVAKAFQKNRTQDKYGKPAVKNTEKTKTALEEESKATAEDSLTQIAESLANNLKENEKTVLYLFKH